jgi:predicted nucleotidyltransferase
MATSKNEIVRDIKNYVHELNKNGISVQKVVLFGSWARGQVREDSDIDVALISDAFSGDRFQDRRKIVPLRRKINTKIEPIPFDQESFSMGGNLVDEIMRYGEEIT